MLEDFLLFLLVGLIAQFVDGALGMGFGPTSSSILLSTGLSPAGVSTTVNLAKVATGVAAAVSHWRFRNIDHGLVLRLAIPGGAPQKRRQKQPRLDVARARNQKSPQNPLHFEPISFQVFVDRLSEHCVGRCRTVPRGAAER